MEMLIGIFGGLLVKLVTGRVVSQLMVIFGRAWSGQTVNKWDDQVLEVIAEGLGMDPLPMKDKLKAQAVK